MSSPKIFPLNENHKKIVQGTCDKLKAILDRGEYTAAERKGLLFTAKLLMAAVF